MTKTALAGSGSTTLMFWTPASRARSRLLDFILSRSSGYRPYWGCPVVDLLVAVAQLVRSPRRQRLGNSWHPSDPLFSIAMSVSAVHVVVSSFSIFSAFCAEGLLWVVVRGLFGASLQ